MQWGDIAFDEQSKFIEVQRALVSGKLMTPKNTNRSRVDVSTQLSERLERRLVAAKATALKAGKNDGPPRWVFTNPGTQSATQAQQGSGRGGGRGS